MCLNRKLIACIIIVTLTGMVGCKHQNDNYNNISYDEYYGYFNYDTIVWNEYYKDCQNILKKNVSFELKFEAPINTNDSDFLFLIIREVGAIYKGSFKEKIILHNQWFCLGDGYLHLNQLAFVLLDHKKRVVYKWYNKETYRLSKWNHYAITLRRDGSFDISLK